MFDWRDPPGKSEWPNGDWEAAQGGHPRQEGGEGTAQETHAAEASAVHHCRLGARTRPGSGGGAPFDNDRTNNPNRGRAGLERAQLELSVIESQLRLRGLLCSTSIKPE